MKEYYQSDVKFLKLDIHFPYIEMLEEAKRMRDRFVPHRDTESKGWASLTLHGLGEDKTGSWKDYGYTSGADAGKDMHWTDVANQCPITTNFFKNKFPCNRYGRIRFMLLKPGGYIGLHSDSRMSLLENINMVLNNPIDCVWKWGDGDIFDMEPGNAYAVNIHYMHSVYNNSDEDRFHIIATRHDALPEWKRLIDDAVLKQNVTGHYIDLPDLP
jgi:hypothetical protein